MTTGFQIHVLPLQWHEFDRHAYTVSEIWPKLVNTGLDQAVLVFDEADIRAYDWNHQDIWLTPAAVKRLRQAGAERLLVDPLGRAFIVTLHGHRLYGGLFYPGGGAAAIRFPVIHALGDPISLLRIRPALGHPWPPVEPVLAAQCHAIADPRLADWLARNEFIRSIPDANRPPFPR